MHSETANTLTHACGLGLSAIGAIFLIGCAQHTGDPWGLVGCGIYAVSVIAVYGASTLSHAVRHEKARYFFRMLDQGCIYLMIAGTYTPFGLTYLRGSWGWFLLTAMWAAALAGFLSKTLFQHRVNASQVWSYVLLGWLPLTSGLERLHSVPLAALYWVLGGGLLYTLGTLFLVHDHRARYFHAVWHLLVVCASAVHFWAVFRYVAQRPVA